MADTEFTIELTITTPGVASVFWTTPPDATVLAQGLSHAGDEAMLANGLRRIEATVPASDHQGRRALVQAGFRQEGVRRLALQQADGNFEDAIIFARLAADTTAGPDALITGLNSVLPKTRVIAHALLRDDDDQILLLRTHIKSDWELPGGILEPHETPRQGAAREIAEELGLSRTVGTLLMVDWMPPAQGWDDALELIFDGGLISADEIASMRLDPEEIAEYRLVSLAEAATLVSPLSHRRLTLLTQSRDTSVIYTEDGYLT